MADKLIIGRYPALHDWVGKRVLARPASRLWKIQGEVVRAGDDWLEVREDERNYVRLTPDNGPWTVEDISDI